MKRQTEFIIPITLVAVIVVSSLVIFENSVLNPEGSHVAGNAISPISQPL